MNLKNNIISKEEAAKLLNTNDKVFVYFRRLNDPYVNIQPQNIYLVDSKYLSVREQLPNEDNSVYMHKMKPNLELEHVIFAILTKDEIREFDTFEPAEVISYINRNFFMYLLTNNQVKTVLKEVEEIVKCANNIKMNLNILKQS